MPVLPGTALSNSEFARNGRASVPLRLTSAAKRLPEVLAHQFPCELALTGAYCQGQQNTSSRGTVAIAAGLLAVTGPQFSCERVTSGLPMTVTHHFLQGLFSVVAGLQGAAKPQVCRELAEALAGCPGTAECPFAPALPGTDLDHGRAAEADGTPAKVHYLELTTLA